MELSSREKFAAIPRTVEAVDVPEWGGVAFVRAIPVAAMLALLERAGRPDFTLHLVGMALCDGGGDPVFDGGDLAPLEAAPGAGLLRVARVAQRLNGLSPESKESLGNA